MSAEKPNFLSQPVVKNVFMFRNGDPYYEARRIVINQRRVCNFETLLREVTGGIQAPFGAVRNIYTPRGGHKVDCLEGLRSGEQYVAAGRERFKKLDYLQIGSRKRRLMQTLPLQVKLPPQNRIIVSPRFLKPIKEPCLIFVVANGDIINPAMRLLIHQRMLEQFDKILEMITEKMGLRVLGGVRSLYTFEGHQVTDGKQLESGHHYVAVGREKFKKLPYSDLLFTKRRGTRKVNGMKSYSLPPIYRFPKQNGNSKSVVRCSDSGGDFKTCPPAHRHNSKEHLSSIVREISQARLISLRRKRSGQSMSLGLMDNDDPESKPVDGNSENQTPEDQPAEEKPAADDPKTTEENDEKAGEKEKQEMQKEEEEAAENTNKEKEEEEEKQEASSEGENAEPNGETEGEKEQGGRDAKEDEVEEDIKKEVVDESKEEVKKEEQSSIDTNSGNAKDRKEGKNGSRPPSKVKTEEEDKRDKVETKDQDSGTSASGSKDAANDVDAGEEEKENSNDPGKARADNESKESRSSRSSSSNSNQEEDVTKANKSAVKESGGGEERNENGEMSGEDDEVENEPEQKTEEKKPSSRNDAAENAAKGENHNKTEDESRKERD